MITRRRSECVTVIRGEVVGDQWGDRSRREVGRDLDVIRSPYVSPVGRVRDRGRRSPHHTYLSPNQS